VIFICENNQFSVYTKLEARQPPRPIHEVARAHGLKAESGDGNDVEAVQQLASVACARARAGEGPQFLEFSVYRWREHCGPNFDDDLGYRDAREVAAGQACCPLRAYEGVLQARGWADGADFADWEADVASEIAAEFAAALASAPPLALSATEKVYAC
jgi:pyruvate dehydrogenase E1 component alpha subunit